MHCALGKIGPSTAQFLRFGVQKPDGRRTRSRSAHSTSSLPVPQAVAAPPQAPVQLPAELENATAVLAAPSGATVYVLGMSHVSKDALAQIEQLISTVQPEIVLVELCKDRTGLLVDSRDPHPLRWHSSRVLFQGMPSGGGWPGAEELVALLKCRGSSPVSAADLEDDAIRLLSTGLFRSARPTAKQPTPASCAPAFVVPSGQGRRLQVVAPLGAIEFVVTPRMLPALQELTVQAEGVDVDPGQLQQVRAEALAAGTAGTPALACLLQARRSLLQAVPEGERAQTEVVFSGAEQGKVQATVRTVPAGQPCSVSGLEGSAPGGQGWGIDSFKRQAKQAVNAGSGGLRIELGLPPSQQQQEQQEQQPGVAQLRPWTREELDMAEASSTSSAPGSNLLAGFLTQTYGSFQAKAGKTVGIWPGAAWRTALQAAAVAGTVQVHLGDRPATTTSERLAAGIWAGSSLQLLGSIPASVASAIIVWQGMEPGGAGSAAAVAAAALLPLLAGAWPVLGPLLEIAQFSGKDAATIEDLVRVKEKLQVAGAPVYKLWGEDALLGWPGAMDPVIHERDAYMATALLAAATGRPQGLTPAYVVTRAADGSTALNYAQPEGGNVAACPPGTGAGAYKPLPAPRAVVGVVGTAHVRGIVAAWERQLARGGDTTLLYL